MKFALIGAGGHAKALVEALRARRHRIEVYVDPRTSDWLDARHIADETEFDDRRLALVFGFGATAPQALENRLAIIRRYLERGFAAPPIVHPDASVSRTATLESAVAILPGAVVQPAARIGVGAIINTRAVVDHDSAIGDGSHVAPGAVVLGGCDVGRFAMIGAGSVVLQGTSVPDLGLVRAVSLWRGASKRNGKSKRMP